MIAKLRHMRAILRKPAQERSLSEKVMISGGLAGFEHAVNIALRLISTLIVTRLLSPEIFGLFGVIITFQVIISLITDFGLRSLIIVAEDPRSKPFLRTCWSVQIVRGLLLYMVILLLALGIWVLQIGGIVGMGTVYGAAELPPALAVAGLGLLMLSLESVNQHVYAREMRFRLITITNLAQAVLTPVATITIALFYPSIWAPVIAGLLGGLIRLYLSFWLFEGPQMRWCWDKRHRHDLLGRGKWIMSHSILTTATNEGEKILLSAFLPAWLFGLYILGNQIYMTVQSLIQKMHGAMGLQIFREIVDLPDRAEMHRKYYRYRLPIDGMCCLCAGLLLTGGPALIDLMYDPRYLEAGNILQVLALGLLLLGPSLIRDAYSAQKRFRIMTLFSVIRAISMWAGLIVALVVMENFIAAFIVVALHRIPELVALLVMSHREGWIRPLQEVRMLPLVGVGALGGWGFAALWQALQ